MKFSYTKKLDGELSLIITNYSGNFPNVSPKEENYELGDENLKSFFKKFDTLRAKTQLPINITFKDSYFCGSIKWFLARYEGGFIFDNCFFDGDLNFSYGHFHHLVFRKCTFQKKALFRQVNIKNNFLFLNCLTKNKVSLLGSRIGGALNFSGSVISRPIGTKPKTAINLSNAVILNDLRMSDTTQILNCSGEILGRNLHVAGQVIFSAASLVCHNGHTIDFQGAVIEGDVFLRNGFKSNGKIDFQGATIGGQFLVKEASLIGIQDSRWRPNFETMIQLPKHSVEKLRNYQDATNVKKSFRKKFRDFFDRYQHQKSPAYVTLRQRYMLESKCSDNIPLNTALSLRHVTIKQDLIIRELQHRPRGSLDFRGTNVVEFCDDRSSWPAVDDNGNKTGYLYLSRFNYKSFSNKLDWTREDCIPTLDYENAVHRLTAEYRRDWLMNQPPEITEDLFLRQPWLHCAKILHQSAESVQAKRLAYKMEKQNTLVLENARVAPGITQLLHSARIKRRKFVRGFMTGYGYSPLRPLMLLCLLWLFGFVFYCFANCISPKMIVPYDMKYVTSELYTEYEQSGKVHYSYPKFNAALYSLDRVIPVLDLRQTDYWRTRSTYRKTQIIDNWRRVIILADFVISLFGWILTTLSLFAVAQTSFRKFKPAH